MNRILYFDLETKYSADEVGGWGNIEDMGMSIGVIWDTLDEKFHVYIEHQIKEMVDHFYQADKIVGFFVPLQNYFEKDQGGKFLLFYETRS